MVTMKFQCRIVACLFVLALVALEVIASKRQKLSRISKGASNRYLAGRHRGRQTMMLDLLDTSPGKESDKDLNQVSGTARKKGDGDDVQLSQFEQPTMGSKKKDSKSSEDRPLDSEDLPFTPAPSSTPGSSKAPSYEKEKGKGGGKGKGSSDDDYDGDDDDDDDEDGKGKGKGGESSKRSKRKKSKSDVNKSSKKLKSQKTSKSSKDSSSSPTTIGAPVLPPSGDPGTRPPIPPGPGPTRAPTLPPSPTSPPIDNGRPTIRGLTPYGLDYTVTENRIPFRSEYLEVVELTRMYLAGYFDEIFADADVTTLNEFLTIFTGSSFNFGQPIWIEYGSSAVFDASSTVVPTVEMLDRTLATAFRGENLNGYIGMLQSLPPGNVFSTTIFVNQTEAGQTRVASVEKRGATATVAAGTAAGAAGIMILAAGLLYYRRQQDSDEDRNTDKKISSSITVAGETFTGESYAGGWSVDQESESQPFRSSHERDNSTIHDVHDDGCDSDETSDENSDDDHEGCPSRSIPTRGIPWHDEMHNIALS